MATIVSNSTTLDSSAAAALSNTTVIAAAATPVNEWSGSNHVPLGQLNNGIWAMFVANESQCVDGGQIRPIMMMAELPVPILATIWSLVDVQQMGAISQSQNMLILGLLAQAQNEIALDATIINEISPSPKLNGLPPV